MRPIKLKTSKEINIKSSLLDYFSINCGQQNITESVQSFLSDLNNTRNDICENQSSPESINDLNNMLQKTTKYLNQLVGIKNKMIFQKNNNDLEFAWDDTLTGNSFTSNNINFEYYNILFNLAVIYFYLGYKKSNMEFIDKNLRKEAIKDYKHSLYLFNIIKEEAINNINQNEFPLDLHPMYCEYNITLCIIYGQIEIVKIAEETNPNEFTLRGKLLMGISENFNKAYNMSNDGPLKEGENECFRNYLLNRSFFYKSLVYKKNSENNMKKFDSTGLGYGEALVYQQLSLKELTECQKTIYSCGGLVDNNNFNNMLESEKQLEAKMADLNHRIYHQYTPEPDKIKLETKVLMVPLAIDNLYIKENEPKFRDDKTIYCEDLDLLTPTEMKQMLDKYRYQMTNYMQQYLSKYESESSIKEYIEKLNLPSKLTFKPANLDNPDSQMSSDILEKISQLEKSGGINFMAKNIMTKSNELMNNLNGILSEIKKEEDEDNYYRQNLGDKWTIAPSSSFNMNYIDSIRNYIDKIKQIRDITQNDDNQITFDKNQIEQKIAELSKGSNQMTSEEKKIRVEIIKLYSLTDKLANIVRPIFKEINSGCVAIPIFADVLSNRIPENAVFELTKDKYMKETQPLEKINNEIKEQIRKINDIIPSISENVLFPMGNDDDALTKYLENLENNMDNIGKLKEGENYFIENERNIYNLIKNIREWIDQRKEEKKACLNNSGTNIPKYNPNAVENPFGNGTNNQNDYYGNNTNSNTNTNNDYYNNQNSNQNNNYNQNLDMNMNMNNQNNKNDNPNLYPDFNQVSNSGPNYNLNENQNRNPYDKIDYNNNMNENQNNMNDYYKKNSNYNDNTNNNNNYYPQNNNYNQEPNMNNDNKRNDYYNQNPNYNQGPDMNQNKDYYSGSNNIQNNNYPQNNTNNLNNGYQNNYQNNNNYPQNTNMNNQNKDFYGGNNFQNNNYNNSNINNQNNQYYNESKNPQNNLNRCQSSNINNQNIPYFNENNNIENHSVYHSQNDIYYSTGNNNQNSIYNNNNEDCGLYMNPNQDLSYQNSDGEFTTRGNIYANSNSSNNNINNNLVPPSGFDQNLDDHFNPNAQNMNNFNPNEGNPFNQNNQSGSGYNFNSPYNK